ncbi:TauD/TfdA family dioxygenase [Lentisalinibacter orientalis]|uniref:TauD/TfdA family dioxygenase n=1 Tax=Lentisalinibacter orientalis TaxID=2992241 RepID=UPI003868473D
MLFGRRSYNTLQAQTLHYFARPHAKIRRKPITGPAAWRGSDLRPSDWTHELTPAEVDEIRAAVNVVAARGLELRRLRRQDFPLPLLAPRIDEWRRELADGRGFQLIRGVPVADWSEDEAGTFFWAFGLHLGIPGTQNPEGDLLGHVIDTRSAADRDSGRYYKTAKNIAYHCDAADVVGLLCLRKAKSGGLSRIVSSVTVYNELLSRRPDLVERLYRPFHLDTHGEGGVRTVPIEPCRYHGGHLRTFYHSDYFRSAFDYEHVPSMSEAERELLGLYESIAEDPDNRLDMDLAPGDIQLVSNHTVLHARTAYEDYAAPTERRHLLRLWLSLPGSSRGRLSRLSGRLRLLARVAPQRLQARLRGAPPRSV